MGSPREHKEHVDLSEGKGKEESKNCGPTSLEFSAPLKACVSTSHESKAAKMDFKPGQSASISDGLTTGYDEESIGEDFSSSDSDKSTDSDTESDTDRCMGCKPKTALQQLSLIRQQAEASEAQLSLSLVATTESCRQILAYFAQPVPDASFGLLSNQVESFFLNIHTFASRLVTSFNKVEQYRQNGFRRSNYDPILAVHGGSPSKQQAALKFLTFEVPGKITPRLDSPERKTFQPGTPRTHENKTLRLGTPQPGSTEKKTPPRLLRRRVSFDDDELPQAQHAAKTLVADLVYRSDRRAPHGDNHRRDAPRVPPQVDLGVPGQRQGAAAQLGGLADGRGLQLIQPPHRARPAPMGVPGPPRRVPPFACCTM